MNLPNPKRWKAHITARRRIAENTAEISLRLDGSVFDFLAGQYVKVSLPRLPLNDPKGGSRNFSIVSSPGAHNLITVAFRVSDSAFKQALLRESDAAALDVYGPLGVFTLPEDSARPLVFIAGGIGIAPFLSIIRRATEKKLPYTITLVYANSSPESAAYVPELEALAKHNSHFTLKTKFGALDVEFLRQNAPESAGARWYIAGPPGMVSATRTMLMQMLVPEENITTEEFSGYDAEKEAAGGELAESAAAAEKKGGAKEIAAVFDVATLSQENLEAVLQALNFSALVSLTDLEGTITYANDTFVEVSGYSRKELIGQNHRILKSGFHPASFYHDMWHEYLLQGKIFRGEIKNKKKDGTLYWVDASIAPIFDRNGTRVGYVGIRFLITQRKQAEEDSKNTNLAMMNVLEDARELERQLTKERDRAQAIIASMGEGLFVVDKEYRIVLMNQAAEKLLGISIDDSIGKDLAELISIDKDGKKLSRDERPVGRTLKSGEWIAYGLSDNVQVTVKSGVKFFIELSTAPLMREGAANEVTGAVVIFRNINEEKKLDDSKTGFISIASHQLRTPLTSMRWFSEMLLAGDAGALNDEQKHFVERVYQGTDRMIDLVNLLLQIARVEGGRIKIEPTSTDFKTLTNGVALTLKVILDQKMQTVEVVTDCDPLPLIPMDQEMVWQVVQNLLSNASRYAPEKSVITVSLAIKGLVLEYAVKDSGIGIPKDQQSKVFEKFFRADNALQLVPEGSGLGLSLVKSLVEEWGGKIWFESEENKGATFYFTVPLSGMKKKGGEVGLKV